MQLAAAVEVKEENVNCQVAFPKRCLLLQAKAEQDKSLQAPGPHLQPALISSMA